VCSPNVHYIYLPHRMQSPAVPLVREYRLCSWPTAVVRQRLSLFASYGIQEGMGISLLSFDVVRIGHSGNLSGQVLLSLISRSRKVLPPPPPPPSLTNPPSEHQPTSQYVHSVQGAKHETISKMLSLPPERASGSEPSGSINHGIDLTRPYQPTPNRTDT